LASNVSAAAETPNREKIHSDFLAVRAC